MTTTPVLYFVVDSLPITRGRDAITYSDPLPYEQAAALRDSLQSQVDLEDACFELCEA
jgi:hypothetical protein